MCINVCVCVCMHTYRPTSGGARTQVYRERTAAWWATVGAQSIAAAWHAELLQDWWVVTLFDGMKGGFFVDLAAYDAVAFSNSHVLERDYAWQGICVEPQAHHWNGLLHRSCTVVAALVGQATGSLVKFQHMCMHKCVWARARARVPTPTLTRVYICTCSDVYRACAIMYTHSCTYRSVVEFHTSGGTGLAGVNFGDDYNHPSDGCLESDAPVSYTHLTLPTILRV